MGNFRFQDRETPRSYCVPLDSTPCRLGSGIAGLGFSVWGLGFGVLLGAYVLSFGPPCRVLGWFLPHPPTPQSSKLGCWSGVNPRPDTLHANSRTVNPKPKAPKP